MQKMSYNTGVKAFPPDEKETEQKPINPGKDHSSQSLIKMPYPEEKRGYYNSCPPVFKKKIKLC